MGPLIHLRFSAARKAADFLIPSMCRGVLLRLANWRPVDVSGTAYGTAYETVSMKRRLRCQMIACHYLTMIGDFGARNVLDGL